MRKKRGREEIKIPRTESGKKRRLGEKDVHGHEKKIEEKLQRTMLEKAQSLLKKMEDSLGGKKL